MNDTTRILLAMWCAAAVGGAWVGPVHADVILDLGRGPVTVHVPPTYDPSDPAPLVMVLHGYGGTGQGLVDYLDLESWSDRLGLLLVAPDGTVDQDGFPFWNATDACCDFFNTGVDDSGYLRELIDRIIAELSVDTERVYMLGYSNGGFMVYRMACDHADIIASVASLAGATYDDPSDCSPSSPVRTLHIHGTEDGGVAYEGGALNDVPYPGAMATAERWASYNQCSSIPDLSPPSLNLNHVVPGFETAVARWADDCVPEGLVELWTVVGGSHDLHATGDFAPLVLNFFLSGPGENELLIFRHFIPAAAFASGAQGSFFQTDVEVNNTGESTGRYHFLWLPRGGELDNADPIASAEYALGPGMGVRYTNAVHEIFGLEPDAVGAITIEANTQDLLFMSRTYTLEQGDTGGTFGQGMPAVAEREMILGREQRHIVFATENGEARTNIGCVNADRFQTRVELALFDHSGNSLDEVTINLGPWANEQLNRVFADFAPVRGSLEVVNRIPFAMYYCYGSVLDNQTSDPTTVLPQ